MIRLSYVVVTDGWDAVAELANALEQQTAAEEIELVVVAERELEPPALGLPIRTIVASGGVPSRADGVRAATGQVVALGETHVVPAPDWARAALDAHDAGATVVLPLMRNANPGTVLSWAAFLLDYGRYAGSAPPTTPVPTYNATVLRPALLELPGLEDALGPGALDQALRARHATVVQAREATLAHVNVDRPLDWTRERVLGGLLLARQRRLTFRRLRLCGYALAAPLIAAVLFRRVLRAPRDGAPGGTVPALALACMLTAFGEAIGYIGPAGSGRAERRMLELETNKRSHARGAV